MICNIYEENNNGENIHTMLNAYLEMRGLTATVNRFQKGENATEFTRAHIDETPALIIDEELVIAGEKLDDTSIVKRIYVAIENETLESDGGSGCGSCGSSKSNGGGCGSTTGICDSFTEVEEETCACGGNCTCGKKELEIATENASVSGGCGSTCTCGKS